MSSFEYMEFCYDGGPGVEFVASADKYSAEEAVKICIEERREMFYPRETSIFRIPTVTDARRKYVAYRLGVSSVWPDGAYTLVEKGERGAFPVHVIFYDDLKKEGRSNN